MPLTTKVEMDEEALKQIAETADGKYFRATNKNVLKGIFEENPIDHADIDSPFPYLPVAEPVDVDNHEQDTQTQTNARLQRA